MNNKSKFVALVAALLVAVSATACNGTTSSAAPSEVSSASSAVSSDASSEASSDVSSEASSDASSEVSSDASSEASSGAAADAVELDPELQTYVDEVTALQAKLTEVQTTMGGLAQGDVDGLKAAVGEAKAILTDLGNVEAPEKLKPAQEKLKSGYTSMNEYFDYVVELAAMEGTPDAAKAAEVQTKVTELMTKAMTDLNDGNTMLAAALAE